MIQIKKYRSDRMKAPSTDGPLYSKKRPGNNLQELSETLQKFLTKLPGCCILLTRTGVGRSEREAGLYAAKAES